MIIPVHITPKSTKNQIIGWVELGSGKRELKIKIAAPPEDGKANAELISFLSKEWGIPKSMFEITGGENSRHKRLKIHDITEDKQCSIHRAVSFSCKRFLLVKRH